MNTGEWQLDRVRSRIFLTSSVDYRIARLALAALSSVIGVIGVVGGLACARPAAGPIVIGDVETVQVREAGMAFLARIDTGAGASSVHATAIRLEGGAVRFTLENERGERRTLTAPVADFARVKSAAGSETRPRVALHLTLAGVERQVLVSLRDRSRMSHKLLVGRDFLADGFLVDVGAEGAAGP